MFKIKKALTLTLTKRKNDSKNVFVALQAIRDLLGCQVCLVSLGGVTREPRDRRDL